MKVYDYPFAPNPQKLRVYLAEKGLDVALQTVDLAKGEQRTSEFLAKNPMGVLPVLELDDGQYLTESLAIIEYLEECHPEPPMIGAAPWERARVRELERFAEMSVFNPLGRVFFHTSPVFAGRGQVPAVAERAQADLPKALRRLDTAIGPRSFVAGPVPSIADCTLFAAFEHGKRAGWALDPEYRNLTRWYGAFAQRPSARA